MRAFIFGLDGTFVQTEKLKDLSCTIAVQRLLGLSQANQRAIESYREIVEHAWIVHEPGKTGGNRSVSSQGAWPYCSPGLKND